MMQSGREPASRRSAAAVAVMLIGSLAPSGLAAYETDQYSPRRLALADAVELLNQEVNQALLQIAGDWRGEPDPQRFARQAYKKLGGRHWVDRLERWAVRNDELDKFDPGRHGSIYSGLPIWATRVNFFFGVGPTIQIDDVLVGTDKIGHFLSQGWKYHKRYLRTGSTERAVRLGVRNEASIFGSPATGTFSNADLVANYEGLRFYRSLFEEGVTGEAIVQWIDGGARIARPFDFRDHVNDYWDEALNPNRYDRLLSRPMLERLATLCPRFAEHPEAWVSPEDEALRLEYAMLGLRDGTSHRLDHVCTSIDRATRAGASFGAEDTH